MSEFVSSRDRALEQLTSEFPQVPVRVVLSVFLGYLGQAPSLTAAVDATRDRIVDACLVAA